MGKVHGTYIQAHGTDPHTRSALSMCCWVEHRRLRPLHSFFPEILTKVVKAANNDNNIEAYMARG